MRIYGVNLKIWRRFVFHLLAAMAFDLFNGGDLVFLTDVLAAATTTAIVTFLQAQLGETYRGRVLWEQGKRQK